MRLASRRAPAGAPAPAPRSARGFTIVELIVSLMVIGVGVLGVAGTATIVVRQLHGASQQTLAANLAQSRFERLRSIPCGQLTAGRDSSRGITEVWTVTSGARTRQVRDSVSYQTRAGRRQHVYVSIVPCS